MRQAGVFHHIDCDDDVHRSEARRPQGMDIISVVCGVGRLRPDGLVVFHVPKRYLPSFALNDVDETAAPLSCVHVLCTLCSHLAKCVGQLRLDEKITGFVPPKQAVASLEKDIPGFRKDAQDIPIITYAVDHP